MGLSRTDSSSKPSYRTVLSHSSSSYNISAKVSLLHPIYERECRTLIWVNSLAQLCAHAGYLSAVKEDKSIPCFSSSKYLGGYNKNHHAHTPRAQTKSESIYRVQSKVEGSSMVWYGMAPPLNPTPEQSLVPDEFPGKTWGVNLGTDIFFRFAFWRD